VRVDQITSYRGAVSYVAKYAAKEENSAPADFTGRRWAASSNLPTDPYSIHDLAPETFHQLRRLARRLLKSRAGRETRFTRHLRQATSIAIYVNRSTAEQLLSAAELISGKPPPPIEEQCRPIRPALLELAKRRAARTQAAWWLHSIEEAKHLPSFQSGIA